jgi:hypothetical protein
VGRGWNHPARLGFVEGKGDPSPVVGLGFKADNDETGEPERFFAPIVCLGPIGTVWIGGEDKGGNGVVGTLTPVNEMNEAYTLTYSESSPGVQTPDKFAHKKPEVLKAFLHNKWEPVAFVAQFTFNVGEDLELKASR